MPIGATAAKIPAMAGDASTVVIAPARRFRRLGALLYALAGLIGTGLLAGRWLQDRRYHRYDDLLAQAAAERGLDTRMLWRMVRRESRFNPSAVGAAGEIGLMQVTEAAARDWARAVNLPAPTREELHDPELNLRIGTWYLARAIRFWGERDEPAVFALAEYNAGRVNAARWAREAETADAFLDAITYPSTRRYIREVLERR